jgi:hypothetical protein
MRRGLKGISDLIGSAVSRPELVRHAKAAQALERWAELVGREFAEVSSPKKYEAGRLTVAVSSAGWLQEMRLQTDSFLKKLNKLAGEPLFSEIRYLVGEVERVIVEEERAPYDVSELDIKMESERLRSAAAKAFGRMKTASRRNDQKDYE